MTTAINGLDILTTVKGTACNKDRARVWVEVPEAKIAPYGFHRGDRVEIERYSDHITIRALPQGSRKVAGRQKKGATICIFDICFPMAEREAMFNGAERLVVLINNGEIRITA